MVTETDRFDEIHDYLFRGSVAPNGIDFERAAWMTREIQRLRSRALQLENEIIANLQGDLVILAESEHLTENALRAEAFSRYEAAVQRWKDLDQ